MRTTPNYYQNSATCPYFKFVYIFKDVHDLVIKNLIIVVFVLNLFFERNAFSKLCVCPYGSY